LNKSAEDGGWICELEVEKEVFQKSNLLNREDYEKFCKGSQ
jgi:glycine cleavage system H lipoate-binding protein